MFGEIVGLQQITITLAFLSVMIAILFFLRRKGGAIRSSLHAGRRIHVIEDTAVAQGERLRLVQIDDQTFVMVSAKGTAPSLVPLHQPQPATNESNFSPAFAKALNAAQDENGWAESGQAESGQDGPAPMELTERADGGQILPRHQPPHSSASPAQADDKQMSDFAVTFKRWRQQR
ncbi:MAG: flagellar biosynthetic protein FliO [Candidatus Puniceispirillaceae bacterium]